MPIPFPFAPLRSTVGSSVGAGDPVATADPTRPPSTAEQLFDYMRRTREGYPTMSAEELVPGMSPALRQAITQYNALSGQMAQAKADMAGEQQRSARSSVINNLAPTILRAAAGVAPSDRSTRLVDQLVDARLRAKEARLMVPIAQQQGELQTAKEMAQQDLETSRLRGDAMRKQVEAREKAVEGTTKTIFDAFKLDSDTDQKEKDRENETKRANAELARANAAIAENNLRAQELTLRIQDRISQGLVDRLTVSEMTTQLGDITEQEDSILIRVRDAAGTGSKADAAQQWLKSLPERVDKDGQPQGGWADWKSAADYHLGRFADQREVMGEAASKLSAMRFEVEKGDEASESEQYRQTLVDLAEIRAAAAAGRRTRAPNDPIPAGPPQGGWDRANPKSSAGDPQRVSPTTRVSPTGATTASTTTTAAPPAADTTATTTGARGRVDGRVDAALIEPPQPTRGELLDSHIQNIIATVQLDANGMPQNPVPDSVATFVLKSTEALQKLNQLVSDDPQDAELRAERDALVKWTQDPSGPFTRIIGAIVASQQARKSKVAK